MRLAVFHLSDSATALKIGGKLQGFMARAAELIASLGRNTRLHMKSGRGLFPHSAVT